ncbi:MAG TPA: protein translocase subunit SecD [Actinomycetota bacterium]|jgi:preprotein translocase subunit SecD|nr:protein translocase subunit SecD [Actinomycetota bacterium]
MKKPRALWTSIVFVLVLVVAGVALLVTGTRPVLGLDLKGGISVILSAPEGTPEDVMDQALENIRGRIDAFGTAEPLLFVTGDTIEVQIPGLARGTIEERDKTQFCLVDTEDVTYGCFDREQAADSQLADATSGPVVTSVCLAGDPFADDPLCFPTQEEADAAIQGLSVQRQEGEFCFAGDALGGAGPCFPTRAEAETELAAIETEETQTFCVTGRGDATLSSDVGPACFPTAEEAEALLSELTVQRSDAEYCVLSSAGENLGCFLSREDAEARLQETGQERLLQVIGQTARLEQREVLEVLAPATPGYDAAGVTCSTEAERETAECSFERLAGEEVVFLDRDGQTKYRLGPVEITGDAINRATAIFDTGGGAAVGQGWQIQFDMTDEGADTFADVTTRLEGRQLAIVVDQEVISAPTVQNAITGGVGVITGSFTEARAKDLATQLNAGALPVALTTEQVQTVSPTLGDESLQQGLVAAVAGLILLYLYLLFYYRVLAIVAWVGMAIWGFLAIALVALAGLTIGYNLTLAGVAGLVISLGVTADSYIVFFERLKDEVHAGKSPRSAVGPGFQRSFKTIVAADFVTAIAALVLYLTAISSVRGFALTLGVSVLLDLFVVYFFKRPAVSLLVRSDRAVNWRWFGVKAGLAADREVSPSAPEPAPAIAGGSG